MKKTIIMLSVFAVILLISVTANAEEYIEITKDKTGVYFKPSKESTLIGYAKKGNVFELKEIKGKWYTITMFSGEWRYLEADACKKIKTVPVSPLESILKKAFRELALSEDKAVNESMKKFPTDFNKQIDFERILNDKYKLLIFQKYSIPIPIYHKLLVQGVKEKWSTR